MPLRKTFGVVEVMVNVSPDDDAHPEHPIYIPITPPPDSGLSPEHPIYFPVGIWGGSGEPFPTPPIFIPGPPSDAHPEHPIYYPVVIWGDIETPEHPIVIPPEVDVPDDARQRLRDFLLGNLPDYAAPH